MLGIIIALFITTLVAILIFKAYKAQTVLFLGGILLMIFTIIFSMGNIVSEDNSTGFIYSNS